MKTNLTIRYISGREEQFEVELFGGASAEDRLEQFAKKPTIVLQTAKEVVVIPATAIECITFPVPEPAGKAIGLPTVRKGKRIK
jgi:hypothetical protein